MKSKEYIIEKIEILINKFPNIKCVYEFDTFDNTHILEILPIQVYTTNQSFKEEKNALFLDFISKYQDEGLFIISTNSDYKITHPILTKEGEQYQPYNSWQYTNKALLIDEVKLNYKNSTNDLINIPTFIDNETGKTYFDLSEIINKNIGEESYCLAA